MNHEELIKLARERRDKNNFARTLGIELRDIGEDFAKVGLVTQDWHKNHYGTVHGGILFSLADNCAGLACMTDGRQYVTQNSNVTFVKAAVCERMEASAKVFHRGKKTALVEVSIENEDEELLLQAMMTFFVHG